MVFALSVRLGVTSGDRGRNEWGHNSPGAESLWERRKVPTMSQAGPALASAGPHSVE